MDLDISLLGLSLGDLKEMKQHKKLYNMLEPPFHKRDRSLSSLQRLFFLNIGKLFLSYQHMMKSEIEGKLPGIFQCNLHITFVVRLLDMKIGKIQMVHGEHRLILRR